MSSAYLSPNPIRLGQPQNFQWDQESRLGNDSCAVTVEEHESQGPGVYQLAGYDSTHQDAKDYTNRMNNRMHFQKQYADTYNYVDNESYLWMAEMNHMRYRQSLCTRPYAGYYCGPGMPSLGNKDLESALQQGISTNLRQGPCESCRGKPTHRFTPLQEYANGQRIEHIEPAPEHLGGWIRGGLPSRDLVRRVDYQRRCGNSINNQNIHKEPPQRIFL
jgi:hypothetical protein